MLEAILILGLMSTLGLSVDKLLLKAHKQSINQWMFDSWVNLSQMRPEALPRTAARLFLQFAGLQRLSLSAFGFFFLKAILVSVFLTTVFFFVGQGVRHAVISAYDPNYGSFFELFPAYIEIFKLVDKPWTYSVNAVFDLVSIFVTSLLLWRFYVQRQLLLATPYIVLNLVLACAIFYSCLYVLAQANPVTSVDLPIWRYHEHILLHWGNPPLLAHWFASTAAYSATVFYPLVLYLSILLLLSVSAIFSRSIIWVTKFVFESSSEAGKSIFFVTGTLLGTISATMKVVVDLAT